MSQNELSRDHPVFYVDNSQEEKFFPKRPPAFENQNKGCCVCLPSRFVLTMWTFLGLLVSYALRANLSVAIVSMIRTSPEKNNSNSSSVCSKPLNYLNSSDKVDMEGEFDWNDKTRGIILGAFFYGYIITQIPGGLLAERFGGKWLFGGGTLITSIATILTPLAARCHVSALIIIRFVAGVGEGVTFPSYFALYSHWVPFQERSMIVAVTNSGSHIGNIISMPLTAWLCEYGFSGGWPSVFYIFGTVGCIWFVFWAFFISDKPETHSCITLSELQYIAGNRKSSKKMLVWSSIPWRQIITSFPLWALAVNKFSGSWAYYTMLTELPTFLNEALNYPIKENGTFNCFLYVAIAVSIVVAGATSDMIRAWDYFSLTTVRKAYQFIGSFGPAVILSLIPSMGCNHQSILALLICSMVLIGFGGGGEAPTALDMSPEYVGIVYGIVNCFGNISGILAPLATGLITNGDESHKNWNYVFYLASIINIIGGAAFLFFGSASLQPWSVPYHSSESDTNLKESSINCDNRLHSTSSKEDKTC